MESNFNISDVDEIKVRLEKLINKQTERKLLYFAGPWFTKKSNLIYEVCHRLVNMYNDFSKYTVFFPKDHTAESPLETFNNNINAIRSCDELIALVDEKDTGTAFEIGYARALNKKITLLGYDDTTFLSKTNIMLAFTGDCITLENFSKFLLGLRYNTIKIIDNWEGKE